MFTMTLEQALDSLRDGKFVLVHDSEGRENEVDMVVAAQHIRADHIATMRERAGGMLCLSLDASMANRLGLRYMHDMLGSSLKGDALEMIIGTAPYGDRPSFSLSVNHRKTYTGITDIDRAQTIRSFAALYDSDDARRDFVSEFRTPGHVPLLIADSTLLSRRRGHTEMSVYLTELAHLSPAAAICEMMDSETNMALSAKRAQRLAERESIAFLDARDLVEYAEVHSR